MRLLFTGGGGAASEALPRLLPQHEVLFADADPGVGVYVIPRGDALGFMSAVAELCRTLAIDLLIPGCDEELLKTVISRNWKALPCEALLPDSEFVATHLDKLRSMQRLCALAVLVPKTQRLAVHRTEAEIARERQLGILEPPMWVWHWLPFPCVIKPREGRGSKHMAIIRSAEQGMAHVVASDLSPAAFVVQELLEGQEYTVTMVADQKARLRAIVPVRVECKRGITIRGTTEPNDAVMEVCWQIHLAMPTSGVYNIQGMLTTAGFRPFEINPRVSTTTCLALAAGVDVIGLAMDSSESVSALLVPFKTMQLRRSWRNEFCEVAA